MQWISVEEKLPEVGQNCLVYRPLAGLTNDPVFDVREYCGRNMVSPQGIVHGFDCWCHPTHWMPLPKPPHQWQSYIAPDVKPGHDLEDTQ